MIVVLDASAAVELVLQREHSPTLHAVVGDADWVLAPSLYVAELTNVFWKYHRLKTFSKQTCERALDHALEIPDTLSADMELYREAFAMACRCHTPAYDMFYLVLARRHAALLLTLDTALAKLARHHDVKTAPV